jgi:hypothetical protein
MGMIVTGASVRPEPPEAPPHRALTLVWIDAREAIVVRWIESAPVLERIESDVPAHHRATGHVRHHPSVRHGGGGVPQTAGEPHRLEHLARFLDAVAGVLPFEDHLLVIGPGTVREHLARLIRKRDEEHRVARVISCEAAAPMTRRQLVARLRRATGNEPRRRPVGAHRWSMDRIREPSGRRAVEPRRVSDTTPAPTREDRGKG